MFLFYCSFLLSVPFAFVTWIIVSLPRPCVCSRLTICWILQHGAVYKLAFGPKAFVVVSDPIVARHILRENAFCYDKVLFNYMLLGAWYYVKCLQSLWAWMDELSLVNSVEKIFFLFPKCHSGIWHTYNASKFFMNIIFLWTIALNFLKT